MALPVLWLPVVGWENKYWVSNTGLVKGRKGELKQRVSNRGYRSVLLEKGTRKNGDRIATTAFVHRLVAKAFIPNVHNYPQVNHKDENPANNKVDNLEWCTAKYNMNYGEGAKTRHLKIDYSAQKRKDIARKNGAMTTSKEVTQINKKGEIVAKYKSIQEASQATNIHRSNIGRVANGDKCRRTAGGYKWVFSKGGVL